MGDYDIDRAANPIWRQGAMDISLRADTQGKQLVQAGSKRLGAAGYKYANTDENFDIKPHEVLFARLDTQDDYSNQLKVMSSLNGSGYDAAQYTNDPTLLAMAVRNQIELAGIAVTSCRMERSEEHLGLTGSVAGLNTLAADNEVIAPGSLVEAYVPPVNDALTKDRRLNRGVNSTKITLKVRQFSHQSSATSMMHAIEQILTDPGKYKQIMNPDYRRTHSLHNAAMQIMESSLFSGIMLIGKLVEKGQLQGADDLVGATATEIVAKLAQFLQVVDQTRELDALPQPKRNAWKMVKVEALRSIFYSGKNRFDEYSYTENDKQARNPSTGRVNSSNVYGQVLDMQLNHFRRALSGYDTAVHDSRRFILGKAVTGATPSGSGKFHLAQGISRP